MALLPRSPSLVLAYELKLCSFGTSFVCYCPSSTTHDFMWKPELKLRWLDLCSSTQLNIKIDPRWWSHSSLPTPGFWVSWIKDTHSLYILICLKIALKNGKRPSFSQEQQQNSLFLSFFFLSLSFFFSLSSFLPSLLSPSSFLSPTPPLFLFKLVRSISWLAYCNSPF